MAPGLPIPAEAEKGALPPLNPQERQRLGDVSAVPQTPSRVPAALAVVLSEGGVCGRGAGPAMRAVGGAGITHPGGSRIGTAARVKVSRSGGSRLCAALCRTIPCLGSLLHTTMGGHDS